MDPNNIIDTLGYFSSLSSHYHLQNVTFIHSNMCFESIVVFTYVFVTNDVIGVIDIFIKLSGQYGLCNTQRILMNSNKIVCKHEMLELTLDCSKLELNLYRILKLLNQVNLLPVIYPERYASTKTQNDEKGSKAEKIQQKSESNKQNQAKRTYEHQMSTIQAMNLIWYSAYMCKSGQLVPYQMHKLSKNKLVGEQNEIDDVIESVEAKIANLKKSQSVKIQTLLSQAKAKLTKIQEIKKIVGEKWSYLRSKYPKEQHPLTQKKVIVGPFGLQINPDHKQTLCKFISKQLIKWDTNILQESIMFIQEIEDGHCIVSLQQCFPSFMVYKELLKSLIGKQHYYKGLKQLLVCKEQSFKQGRSFMPQKYAMCHLCKRIEPLQQIKKIQTQKICTNNPKQPNISSTSHAFEELHMKINYHHLPLKDLPETEIKECYEQSKQFQSYVHPYHKIYYPQCSRYYCEACLITLAVARKERKAKEAKKKGKEQREDGVKFEENTDMRSQQGNDMISQKQPCLVCQKCCSCDRCSLAQKFKKLLAAYQSLGGSFQDLHPELMFINFYCTRVHLQLVTFTKEEQRSQYNSEENRVQLQKTDEETLSYPQQVVKLQGWFCKLRDKQRVKLYGEESVYGDRNDDCESVDQSQIFPQLQEMYSKLLKEEEQQQQQKVKICEEDKQSMISKRSKSCKHKVSSSSNISEDQS